MSDPARPVPSAGCPAGIDPADVTAWAVDGEPLAGIDLAAHVPTCPACTAAVEAVAGSRGLGDELRRQSTETPQAVTSRALGRIRLEATATVLARTFGGAVLRLLRAAPDYLRHDRDTQGRIR